MKNIGALSPFHRGIFTGLVLMIVNTRVCGIQWKILKRMAVRYPSILARYVRVDSPGVEIKPEVL